MRAVLKGGRHREINRRWGAPEPGRTLETRRVVSSSQRQARARGIEVTGNCRGHSYRFIFPYNPRRPACVKE